ncbi:MAG: PEP-CTERM sorting domain-containing protein, partial [Methylococcaceae bacterium]|nr:PEP-CTERM sorting domain-containing protein [Methylococcaceae bacterium]
GTINNVGGFDWAPGSALSVGSLPLPLVTSGNETHFTVYSQASLSSYLDTGNGTISDSNLGSNYEITYVLGFGEIGVQTSNIPTGPFAGSQGQFAFDSNNPVNFFAVYYDSNNATFANALAGTGYDDGQLILAGTVVADDGGSQLTTGNFQVSFVAPGLMDKNGTDNWGGKKSYTGSGSNTVIIDLAQQNVQRNFFSGLDISGFSALSILDSNAKTPFNQTDPSQHVGGSTAPNERLATLNGDANCDGAPGGTAPCDFLFQNDGSQKLNTAPEPDALALLGLGVLGMGLVRRKKSA